MDLDRSSIVSENLDMVGPYFKGLKYHKDYIPVTMISIIDTYIYEWMTIYP